MQSQKSKITYWVNGETVTEQEFINLTGEYFKYFEGSDVKAVDYSFVESLFDGNYKSQRQINEHLKDIIGHSTRHKAREEGKFHKYPLTPEECFVKDDVITSSNRGEKETLDYLNKMYSDLNTITKNPLVLDTHTFPHFPKRGKTIKYEPKKEDGVKETEGKLNYEIDWQFIQQLAERMSQNKGKYEPYNWTKPMDVEKLKQSLFRHVIEVMKGNYSDDGREFGHLESIALNAMMINHQLKNNK